MPETARYCPACGQSTRIFRRPWLQVFREVLDELFDFDGRMLVSLRLLLTRPGLLARDYNGSYHVNVTLPVVIKAAPMKGAFRLTSARMPPKAGPKPLPIPLPNPRLNPIPRP